jgi:RNA polymerase primary sigma factor
MQHPTSLDASFDDADELSLADRIADGEAADPALAAEFGDVQTELRQALDLLDERERQVLELRFGLVGDDDLTLVEVGERLGISRERVRQVEIRAIKKLRFRVRSIRRASPPSGGHS